MRVQLTRYVGRQLRRDSGVRPAAAARAQLDGSRCTSSSCVRAACRRARLRLRPEPPRRSMPTGRSGSRRRPARATVALTFLNRTPALLENCSSRSRSRSRADRTATTRRRRAPTSAASRSAGPTTRRGAGDTPSRDRIFVCRPATASQTKQACAKKILSTLARRAFRRPVTDADIATAARLLQEGRAAGDFEPASSGPSKACW